MKQESCLSCSSQGQNGEITHPPSSERVHKVLQEDRRPSGPHKEEIPLVSNLSAIGIGRRRPLKTGTIKKDFLEEVGSTLVLEGWRGGSGQEGFQGAHVRWILRKLSTLDFPIYFLCQFPASHFSLTPHAISILPLR